jgi:hypothetical protein
MLSWTIGVTLSALFVLLFVALQQVFSMQSGRANARSRLRYRREGGIQAGSRQLIGRLASPDGHLALLLDSVRWQLSPSAFVILSLVLTLTGLAGGTLAVHSVKGAVLSAVLLGGLPYLTLRFVLSQRQLQSRVEFLPAVELFYQSYLTTGGKQVRIALGRTVEEKRLMGPLQPVFEQLYLNLSVKGDDEASLRIFVAALGHLWGEYFANLLRVALAEGYSIESNLKALIGDMRQAQRSDQIERNRLLEIRLANFSPVLFLALFLGINFHYNPDGSYAYYLADPKGRDMLLNAAALIFASFLMGIYLSRRRM